MHTETVTEVIKSKDITDDLYGIFEKTQYNREEIIAIIKRWVDKNKNIKSNVNIPDTIEFGDVILFSIANRNHPCVVFKKENNICHALVLSTKQYEHHFIAKIEQSRLFTISNFTSTIISLPEDQAKRNFIGIFDSPQELKKAVKLVKTKYKRIL